PPIQISPEVISSNPAIMRSVVDLPQPDGPTRTTNSSSSISRSMPFTAWTLPSNALVTLRIETCAIVGLSFRCACRETGDVVVHQERVHQYRRGGSHDARGHDLAPYEYVAVDQPRIYAGDQHHLVAGIEIGQRVEERPPAY